MMQTVKYEKIKLRKEQEFSAGRHQKVIRLGFTTSVLATSTFQTNAPIV